MATPSDSISELPPVHVKLKPRSDGTPRDYKVHIGRGILSNLRRLVEGEKLLPPYIIIADKALLNSKLYDQVRDALMVPHRENIAYLVPKLAQGEEDKSWEYAGKLLEDLDGIHRYSTIIALGGGVVGDLAGFVAAVCLRGINFIQIPTTLLAMVDSSVGGKTGVNLGKVKNRVGAFHQPKLVVADLDTLSTLPPREFAAGMAEVIKYGAIKDKALFDEVAKGLEPTSPKLERIIRSCIEIKAHIVEKDEFETGTQRALLNFGHTIGHAIEGASTLTKIGAIKKARELEDVSQEEKSAAIAKAMALPNYLHGEAISLGMRAAAWLSHQELKLPLNEFHQIEAALNKNELPTHLPSKSEIDPNFIWIALFNDKKVAADGKIRWVLLKNIGEASPGHQLPDDHVREAINLLYEPISHSKSLK